VTQGTFRIAVYRRPEPVRERGSYSAHRRWQASGSRWEALAKALDKPYAYAEACAIAKVKATRGQRRYMATEGRCYSNAVATRENKKA